MSKSIFRLMFLLMISVGLLTSVTAQKKTSKKPSKIPAVFQVNLPISVTDKKRQFVSNLTSEDFIVWENGRRQKTAFFTDEKNSPPVFVGVLMDISTSMKGKTNLIKEGVKNLVYSITRLKKGKAAFLTFDDKINFLQDFTNKIDLLDKAIDKVEETGQQNVLYDAIYQFCDEKLRNAPGKRVLVIVSDGEDTFSRVKFEDATDIAQRTETVIFIVSTSSKKSASPQNAKNRKNKNMNDNFLLHLTTETGGTIFFADNMLNLEKAFAKIVKEIRSQYVLTYSPTNQKYDGKKRRIKVRFTDSKKNEIYQILTKTKYRVLKSK